MLVEFRLKNYRSFRDEQTFSMVASNADKRLLANTIDVEALGKRKLLRSAVVYGANASGKSNFIRALGVVQRFIGQSRLPPPSWAGFYVEPFALDERTAREPAEFELTFIQEGVRYQYGFALDRERVREEWLYAYPNRQPQLWFRRTWVPERENTEWYFGPRLMGEKRKLEELTRDDTLFLSVAVAFNHEQLSRVHDWFRTRFRVTDLSRYGWMWRPSAATVRRFQSDPDFRRRVRDLLSFADLGIQDFTVEEEEVLEYAGRDGIPVPRTRHEIYMWHEAGLNADGTLRQFRLSYEEESQGTRRYFELAPTILATLERGGVLAVDELDASLHPLLVRRIVELFHDPEINRHGAQLIFNTHDVTLLDSRLVRRDQVWFTEKDRAGASHLYPLLQFSPRQDEALGRGYLQGRYGAIPFFGDWPEGLALDGEEEEHPATAS